MATATTGQIVDDFENSFQACLAALTNPDHFNVRDSEEIKTGVEQTIQRFLDLAKQMECFFLQKRLLLSVQKPEQIILEDINELKNEIARKEQLMQKYSEKIQYWQSLLSDNVGGSPRPLPQQATPLTPPQVPIPPPQQQQHMSPMHHGIPPNAGQHFGPPPTQQIMGMPPQQSMVPPPQHVHPNAHIAPHQGGLQGPLAYLERTTSNIG